MISRVRISSYVQESVTVADDDDDDDDDEGIHWASKLICMSKQQLYVRDAEPIMILWTC